MIETIYRSEDGAIEVYRRPDGQARLILRKPGFTNEVKASSRDITEAEAQEIVSASKLDLTNVEPSA
jgi:hypothetical protein